MKPPTMEEKSSGYILKWEEGVSITVSRLHEEHDDIIGELTVSYNGADPPHLGWFKLNLLSEDTRARRAKTLAARCGEVRWAEVLEQLCIKVVQIYRAGEPVKEIWVGDDYHAPEYLLYPILPLRMPTVVFGDPGSGKSALSLVIAYCIILPWEDNTLGLVPKKEPTSVLVLDWETHEDELGWRLSCLSRGLGLPPVSLSYLHCRQPLTDSIDEIQDRVEETKARCLIIDSLGMASGGDLFTAGTANEFFRALRRLDMTSLILAHTQKNSAGGDRSIFGSQFYTANARAVWEVKRYQEVGEDELTVGLFHRKANTSRLSQPIGLRLTFNNNATSVVKCDLKKTELVSSLPIRDQIWQALSNEPMTLERLCEEVSAARASIKTTLYRHKDIFVKNVEDQWYVFPEE